MPLIYVNQVGGQDELVFDGASFVIGADASLRAQSPAWESSVQMTEWSRDGDTWSCAETDRHPSPEGDPAIYSAMVLGLRDYVRKSGFPGVLIGMSGGDRFRADGSGRRRRTWPGSRPLRDDAVALYVSGKPGRRG